MLVTLHIILFLLRVRKIRLPATNIRRIFLILIIQYWAFCQQEPINFLMEP